MRFNRKYFLISISLFLVEIIIALFFNDNFIRPYFGDFLVVILIYSFIRSFFNFPVLATAVGTLVFAYLIEISQYYKLVELLGLGKSKLARVVLGSSFAWSDMLAYTLGIVTVILIEKLMSNKK